MKRSITTTLMDHAVVSVSSRTSYRPYRNTQWIQRKKILLIVTGGHWQEARTFANNIQERGYQIAGVLLNHEETPTDDIGFTISGKIQDLQNYLKDSHVDAICITMSSSYRSPQIKHAIETANYHGVRVNLIPANNKYLRSNYRTNLIEQPVVVPLRKIPLDNAFNASAKKVFDLLFSAVALVMLLPIISLIALLIAIDSKGPVIYAPYRKGRGNKSFKCYKFRTMTECDDPMHGKKSTSKDDPRITRIGKFLRKYDLDELPQFINVLKGDMSVVGPRPHRLQLSEDFRKVVYDYMVRHYVKPGITGWAQVNGWRGPTSTEEQKLQRVQHDQWYIDNWKFLLDIEIIFRTVFSRKTRMNAF